MNPLPDPLHPALVHFPIVLILLGTGAAVASVFWRRNHLPLLAGLVLALGAVGAWVSVESGESDGALLEERSPQVESILDAHEDWAKRTLAVSVAAAVAAALSVALFRLPRLARVAAVLAAAAAVGASFCVYQTGHRGGTLVYQHGAGVGALHAPLTTGVRTRTEDAD